MLLLVIMMMMMMMMIQKAEEVENLSNEDEWSIIKSMQKMMSGAGWKKKPSSMMFMKLFR